MNQGVKKSKVFSGVTRSLVALAALATIGLVAQPAGATNKRPPASACRVGALTPKFNRTERQASMGYHVINCGGLTMQEIGFVWLTGEVPGRNNDIILSPGKMSFWPAMGNGRFYIPAINCNWNKNGLDAIYTRIEWTNARGETFTRRSKTIKVNCSSKSNIRSLRKGH